MRQLHPIQRSILEKLLYKPALRYMQMKAQPSIENNLFTFHLKQLLKGGFIVKGKNNMYSLTNKGKDYANRIDPQDEELKLQAKLTVWICPVRTREDGEEYLVYTRLKNPFYGGQGFMTGKLKYGEKVLAGARRELKEETNLQGDIHLVSIRHYLVIDQKSDTLVEDKLMFLCKAENLKGKLVANKEGKFEWIRTEDFESAVTNHFESFAAFQRDIALIKRFTGEVIFEEFVHRTKKY